MLITSLAFILGLAIVFIAFGAGATVLGQTLRSYKNVLEKISGVLLVIFGLHLAGVFRIRFLDQDTRIQTSKQPAGPLGAVLVGMAFAFGWSPCIGRLSAGILAIAGSRESVGEGVSCSRFTRPASACRF